MNRFTVTDLPLAGLKLVERRRFGDSRGFLARLFCAEELAATGWLQPIAQINHTFTTWRGTVRGMHFQRPPHAEAKLVTCLQGEVWDVAVDLRAGSPTFLHWHAERLSADNARALLIPEGFAHGFQTLTNGAALLYCHSAAYAPGAEGGLHPQDERLGIAWPLEIRELSVRDAMHPMVEGAFEGVAL
ncbi:dTDP-4-dehydrorhamnose 3,5-epimerase [Azotobacter vinelandii CA]|uniref:dTDP-4-dehydrorhamnose 3,5-epimerase n=3 Tax=Azotobacter vinelandii TaxID=354 RepID=C1DKU6_AZOVD|nr:dTDP-4-dehydrorhamnose 3,5-epimerase [Azotobacter vinelandii]ACO78948.1 dTDP-4-dehydrorhamnose 3,5-epimerase [Azotobacter vinelandii DJ]AGK13932.1 dTDP-4-dehydrorhamnose 3,5-epimerase [Azotobacter vinelandii CA]AGK18656.1 dTDP-4-dehydrorhamnose 3,5-epimerase [Azotobacter vinelandii CA6]WKN19933.1 dTDP-4-dehydrorhamnose 3,5-epimerase [Azotobacter vinelandii]SFY12272.1 dTDP-4-dehydrorhamnose 3,5-epimerase [Azotobacter vinelandii]